MAGEAHTPGPWEVTDGGDEYGNYIRVWASAPKVDGACEPLIAEVSHVDHAPHECSTAEARANARLIAAAPTLLAAAILAEDIIDDFLGHLSPEEQVACTDDPKAAAALKALRAAISLTQAGEGAQ